MDGNLWAGKGIINNDPKKQNQNGKLFEEFLLRNPHLSVVNALTICEGDITRVRHIKERTEETMIDFFVVCDQILPLVSKMSIDTIGEYTLTRFKGKVVKSDHRMLKLNIDLTFHKEKKHERVEVFNLRNIKCQQAFQEFTSKGNNFSRCISSQHENIDIHFQRWQRRLKKAIHACFRKTRKTAELIKKPSNMDSLMRKRKTLLRKKTLSEDDEIEIYQIEQEISDEIADREFKKLEEVVGELDDNTHTNIWKEMKKAFPSKQKPLPTGVKNIKGKLITNPEEKKKITLEHFEHRMRKRAIKEDIIEIRKLHETLFEERLNKAKHMTSDPFDMEELNKVLKSLKTGKSRYPDNLICELFKIGVIGDDLKMSILIMMNKIKN